LGKKTAADHFFYFEVPNIGETKLVAVAGECKDESVIRKVDTFNEDYRLKEEGAVINWFDIDMPDGRLSLNSKMSEIISTFRGKLMFMKLMGKMLGGKKKGEKAKPMGFEMTPELMSMMGGFTVLRLLTMAGGMMDAKFTKEDLLNLNKKLSKIRTPKKK
jgi:beta-galactosidase